MLKLPFGRECPSGAPAGLPHSRVFCYQDDMPDLTPDHVKTLAASLGVSAHADDLEEVTHRLNAFLDALAEQTARLTLVGGEVVWGDA